MLVEAKFISLEVQYIDGTKIEANANKYTFVWKKSTQTNQGKLDVKVRSILREAERVLDMEIKDDKDVVMTSEQMRAVEANEDMVIVATGRYVGEGFDLPRLDTLLLALPVSWKGIVAQYAGRLHREYDGKMTCQIYDYVDIGNAICEKMYRRRLRAYKSIGYATVNSADDVEKCGYIYDGRDFTEQFIKDISSSTREVIISAPRISRIANPKVAMAIRDRLEVGISVRIITSEVTFDRGLFDLNIEVVHTEFCSAHFAVIDRNICWYGDINLLGYNTSERTALRLWDRTIAEELINI